MKFETGCLLCIYIGEKDQYDGLPLYEWILKKAESASLAGATVLRGLEGFGAHHRMHTAKIMRLSADLPIVIEILDKPVKIDGFLPVIQTAIKEGVVSRESLDMCFIRQE